MQLKHVNVLDTVRRVQGFLVRQAPHSVPSSRRRSTRGSMMPTRGSLRSRSWDIQHGFGGTS